MSTQVVTALFAAIVGGFVAHLLTSARDRANARRQKRVDYLIEAYRRLEACSNLRWSEDEKAAASEFRDAVSKMASAISDIQLFGTATQVKLAQQVARTFADTRAVSLDELLMDLRRDLRKELNLEDVPIGVVYLRHHPE